MFESHIFNSKQVKMSLKLVYGTFLVYGSGSTMVDNVQYMVKPTSFMLTIIVNFFIQLKKLYASICCSFRNLPMYTVEKEILI